MQRWWLCFGVALALGLAGCGGAAPEGAANAPGGSSGDTSLVATAQAQPPAPLVGRLAPDFTLSMYDGDTLTLSALKGRPVIVNFWATWCAPCRLEMPELEAAAAANPELAVIGVQIQSDDGDAQAFLEEVGVSFATGQDADGSIQKTYLRRDALPTTFFLDPNGIVRYVQLGPMDKAFIEEQLAQLLP